MREATVGHRIGTHALPGLPVLCVAVVCVMWRAESRPLDFVCDRSSRMRAMGSVAQMQTDLSACGGAGGDVTLPSPLRLPCIKVHKASWESKSHQEKRGDIIASLGLLGEEVRTARAASLPVCVSALLQRLEHSVTNHQHILTHLQFSGAVESLLISCVPRSSQNLSAVLSAYSRLLTGKLEWLMVTLEDRCAPPV